MQCLVNTDWTARYLYMLLIYSINQCMAVGKASQDSTKVVPTAMMTSLPKDEVKPSESHSSSRIALLKVVKYLEDNDEEQSTVKDVCEKRKEYLAARGRGI